MVKSMILSLKFDVLNNIKTEVVNGRREYRFPFTIVGETTFAESKLFKIAKSPHLLHAKILRQVRDLLILELAEERVVESNSESSNGTRQNQEASSAIGGPDQSNVQSKDQRERPIQHSTSLEDASIADILASQNPD